MRLHLWRAVDLCHKLDVLVLPLKLFAVGVGRDVGRCRIGGASSGCCGLFHFATWSFFQPQKCSALLQLLLCFNCLMNVLAGSESAELWSPSLQFEAPRKQTATTGSSCGNVKLQTSSLTKRMQLMQTGMDKYQHPGWSLQKLLCEGSAAEGIQYAPFPCWLQTHVSETCAIALLFVPPSDLPKADYKSCL